MLVGRERGRSFFDLYVPFFFLILFCFVVRSMWEVISSLSASRSVILTTHSMEECEAVCDRLGIMVGGRLRCLGTSQHLKGRFGGGYSVEVRASPSIAV